MILVEPSFSQGAMLHAVDRGLVNLDRLDAGFRAAMTTSASGLIGAAIGDRRRRRNRMAGASDPTPETLWSSGPERQDRPRAGPADPASTGAATNPVTSAITAGARRIRR